MTALSRSFAVAKREISDSQVVVAGVADGSESGKPDARASSRRARRASGVDRGSPPLRSEGEDVFGDLVVAGDASDVVVEALGEIVDGEQDELCEMFRV